MPYKITLTVTVIEQDDTLEEIADDVFGFVDDVIQKQLDPNAVVLVTDTEVVK